MEHAAKAGNLALVQAENDGFIAAAEQFIADLKGVLDILEEKRQKPQKAAPDPVLLARVREAAEHYDMGEIETIMEELEQCRYESDTDLVPWLREQIDKAEFEEIAVRLMPAEGEMALFVEA
jgi:hypothetical protein